MDPFLDLIRLLRPSATLWSGIDAVGRWGLSFPKKDDLLFCWLESGSCELLMGPEKSLTLKAGDFVLIRTVTQFALASDLTVELEDSEAPIKIRKGFRRKLGAGSKSPVSLNGGKFVFDTANSDLITDFLPPLVYISSSDNSSQRMQSLLAMNRDECLHPGPGKELVIKRLMELTLVEILRNHTFKIDQKENGMLAGLANPLTAKALSSMHRDIAHDWTVANLAALCGVSRSTFANKFYKIVGVGPIEYLLRWRMAVAKDELRRGEMTITEIAFKIGFQSASAFSTAFTRVMGCSPKRFKESINKAPV